MGEVEVKPLVLRPKYERLYVIIIVAALLGLAAVGYFSFTKSLASSVAGSLLAPFLVFAIILIAAIALAIAFLRFLAVRWEINAQEIIMSEGIITKTVRTVPMKKVDNITTRRNFRDLILDTGTLVIDTPAGGGAAEIIMATIDTKKMNEAAGLIKYLIGQSKHPPEKPVEEEKQEGASFIREETIDDFSAATPEEIKGAEKEEEKAAKRASSLPKVIIKKVDQASKPKKSRKKKA